MKSPRQVDVGILPIPPIMKFDPSKLPHTLFITGTDTDAGKTYATGWLANEIAHTGKTVITQKLIQTGNSGMSEDIEMHRRIMGTGMLPRDIDHTTAPLILTYPSSPDLAAKIDNTEVDYEIAARSTAILESEFDHVLVEGAGGLMVPLKGNYLTINYVRDHKLPIVLVTNGKLGSINHTLLTLAASIQAGIEVALVLYNPYFDYDETISADTRQYLTQWLGKRLPGTLFVEMPK